MLGGLTIGRLDTRVRIQQKTLSVDSIGATNTTWSNLSTVWVERVRRRGGEVIEANQQVGNMGSTYTGRFKSLSSVTQNMRITEDVTSADSVAQWFYVIDIQRYNREGYVMIMTEKKDNQ